MAARPTDWPAALERIWPIPADHRDAQVDRVAALDMLRCGETALDELVAAGLPADDRDGGQYFDRFDLFNLALASGSGTSVPERAIRYALRWMQGGPPTWVQPLHWTFDIELQCPAGSCPADAAGEPSWWHARLDPEHGGGALTEFATTPPGRLRADERIELAGVGPVALRGSLTTRGELMQLVSPTLRALTDDFLAAGYAWGRMPELLQREYDRVVAAGMAPCISASLYLQREFRRAGYDARTRRGWLLGMLDLAHSWIEVVDDDGVVKVVDPVFSRLVEHADRPHPELARAVLGSRVNRLLPAAIPADGDMVGHRCGGRHSTPLRRTVIRRTAA
ncbi:hypothetical protein [Jatrophihabitans endophyticus]|uniref:hypothetical protein n=1 Tax=Jatrophihabitans endophyticus TaxID=1206085 RepID=UPI0009341D39|nr:hypothetical protein [Jatrophihabitans endophyticus]